MCKVEMRKAAKATTVDDRKVILFTLTKDSMANMVCPAELVTANNITYFFMPFDLDHCQQALPLAGREEDQDQGCCKQVPRRAFIQSCAHYSLENLWVKEIAPVIMMFEKTVATTVESRQLQISLI